VGSVTFSEYVPLSRYTTVALSLAAAARPEAIVAHGAFTAPQLVVAVAMGETNTP
jgi:hypothetical protein